MSGVFRNIEPPNPSPPGECGAGGGHTRWVEREWGVNSSKDARHCPEFYICKYSVLPILFLYHRVILFKTYFCLPILLFSSSSKPVNGALRSSKPDYGAYKRKPLKEGRPKMVCNGPIYYIYFWEMSGFEN